MQSSFIALYLFSSLFFTFTFLFSLVGTNLYLLTSKGFLHNTNQQCSSCIYPSEGGPSSINTNCSKMGKYFQVIQALPLIFSSEAFISVFSDDIGSYMHFLMALAEALAVHFFVEILLWKLGL